MNITTIGFGKDKRSYGWWPRVASGSPLNFNYETEGELNGVTLGEGTVNSVNGFHDAYEGSSGGDLEQLPIYTRSLLSNEQIIANMEKFAKNYKGRWKALGRNCRTFIKDMFKATGVYTK